MCFLLGNCKSLGLESWNEAEEPPSGLKGYLLGFPTSPSVHNAAPVEAVGWPLGVAGGLEDGSGDQAISWGRWTHFTSCHAQRGQAPPTLSFLQLHKFLSLLYALPFFVLGSTSSQRSEPVQLANPAKVSFTFFLSSWANFLPFCQAGLLYWDARIESRKAAPEYGWGRKVRRCKIFYSAVVHY